MPAQVLLWNAETNAPEEVAPDRVRSALASGKYTEFSQGRTDVGAAQESVDFSSQNGKSLDRILLGEEAAADPFSVAARYSDEARAAQFDNARDKIKTFGEGIVGAMTLGATDLSGYDLSTETRQEELSGYGTAGKLVGIAGSIGAPVSPLGALAKGAGAVGANVAARIGGVGGKLVGAGIEGALFGVADEAAHQTFDAVIRDRPFVAERLATAATIGGLTGFGTTAALEGAAKVVAGAKASSGSVSKAVLTDEARATIGSGVKDAHSSLDSAVDAYAQRFKVLDDAKRGADKLGRSVEADFIRQLDPAWFETRAVALKEANAAKRALGRFNPEKVLDLDKAGLKAYTKAWQRYEGAVSKLDDLLGDAPVGAKRLAEKMGTRDTVVSSFRDLPTQVPLSGPFASRPVASGFADAATVVPSSGPFAPALRDPFFSKFFDDWASRSAVARPVGEFAGKLSNTAKSITDATEMAGNLPAITGRLGVEPLIGRGEYTDALVDAWGAAQFAQAVGKEASGKGSFLRKLSGERESAIPWHRRRAAELVRFSARKEMGYGYEGFLAGQAAFAIVAGKLGKVLSFADEAKDAAAAAVEKLLSGGRAMAGTKLLEATRISYTGRDDDATTSAVEKGEQLRNMLSNEEALRARIRKNLEPIARVSPDLATEMEDVQVNRMRNLANKAPSFLALPGAQLPQEKGKQYSYFNDYEAVTHDPHVAIDALRTNSLTKPMVDALKENHPRLTATMIKSLYGGLTTKQMLNMSKQARQQAELLLGYPLFPSMGPSQQAAYAASKQQAQQMGGDGGPPNPRAMPRPSQGAQLMAPNFSPGS